MDGKLKWIQWKQKVHEIKMSVDYVKRATMSWRYQRQDSP